MRRLRAWIAPLFLSLVSCAVGMAVIEGAARLLVRSWDRDTTRQPLTRYHPLLGWDKPPGASAWLRRPEYRVFLQINSHGLRGPDVAYEPAPGTRRILLLGDSFTEGYAVAEEQTVRAQLENVLRARGERVEVINGGTAAYGTDQEYLFFTTEGRKYQPDVVVLLFFYNDLTGDTLGGLQRPRFELEPSGQLVLRNVPVPPPRRTRPDADRGLKPWRGSYALRLLSERTALGSPRLHRALAALGLVEPSPTRRSTIPEDFLLFRVPPPQTVIDGWVRMRALLRALDREVQQAGARLIIFYVPIRFEIDDRSWELTREAYSLPDDGWDRDAVFARLHKSCARIGIPLVDPRAEFRQATHAGEALYFRRDGHWNRSGHAKAAEILARTLARGQLDPRPATPSPARH